MTSPLLVLFVFASLLLKGLSNYYDIIKLDLYNILVPFIIWRIIINTRKNKIAFDKGIFFYWLFMFSIFLSIAINNAFDGNSFFLISAFKGTISYLAWPLIFLLISTENFSQKESIRFNKLIWILGIVTAANTLIPFVIYFFTGATIGEFVIQNGGLRSFGFLTDQVGFALVYFVILSVFEKRFFWTGIFLMSIFVTGTRGAIIFSLLSLIVSFVFYKNREFSLKAISIKLQRGISIIFILVICWISLGGVLGKLINLRFDEESIDDTSEQRIGAMSSGMELFIANPFFGVGFGNFAELVYGDRELSNNFNYYRTLSKEENMRGYANAQNEFVNVLVNGGLFSLIAVVFFIYNVLKKIRKKINITASRIQNEVYIFIVLAILFIQTTIYMFNPGVTSFFVLILLGRGNSKSLY